MVCFHATPDSLDDITHAGKPARVGEWSGNAWMACGHTHIQAMWRVGDQIWLNPGSVGLPGIGPGASGLPVNRDVSWAEYAVVEVGRYGTTVTLRRIELDIEAMWSAVTADGHAASGLVAQSSGRAERAAWPGAPLTAGGAGTLS